MRVYLDADGLSEGRFVAMAVLVWLALLVVWFGAPALRGRRTASVGSPAGPGTELIAPGR